MIAWLPVLVAMVATIAPPVAASEPVTVNKSAGELRICVDPDNPPLSLNRVGAQPTVGVAQAIAMHLDLRPHLIWVDTTFGGRAPRRSLVTGQCNIFMGLPADPAAQTGGALALTTPYYSTGYRLIGALQRSIATSPTDLRNARIGVERQSGAHMRLEKIGSDLVAYGNQREVLDAVALGEVDARAVWLTDIDRLLQGRVLAVRALINAAPDEPLRWNMAIGVRSADADLHAALNRAIGDLDAEGRIEAIFARYDVPHFPPFADR